MLKYPLFISNQTQENSATTSQIPPEIPAKNFMANIDLDLIGVPWRKSVIFQKGDPEWKGIGGTSQFCEPNPPYEDKFLAYYDFDAGCPFFYGNGWLRPNPRLKNAFTWCKRADENPYPDLKPEGMFRYAG